MFSRLIRPGPGEMASPLKSGDDEGRYHDDENEKKMYLHDIYRVVTLSEYCAVLLTVGP